MQTSIYIMQWTVRNKEEIYIIIDSIKPPHKIDMFDVSLGNGHFVF